MKNIIGRLIHLENGQIANLNDIITTSKGETKYLVSPVYEGEAFGCSSVGGEYHEYSAPYAHEGPDIIVDNIFVEEPLEKIGEGYRIVKERIETASLALGELQKLIKTTELSAANIKAATKVATAKRDSVLKSLAADKERLEVLTESIYQKRQKLSELEDSLSKYTSENTVVSITKKELQTLRKESFKLNCLDDGGIDNWEWYGEALKDYRDRYPDD